MSSLSKHCFWFFFVRLTCIHTAYSALLRNQWGPLSQTEGIPLVQQRQNTMFRLIKKKTRNFIETRTAEKHFGIYLVTYLAKGTQALCILETTRLKAYTVVLKLCTKYWVGCSLSYTQLGLLILQALQELVDHRRWFCMKLFDIWYTNCKGWQKWRHFSLSNGLQ